MNSAKSSQIRERVTLDYLIKALSQFGNDIGIPYNQNKSCSEPTCFDLQQSGSEYRIVILRNGKRDNIITDYASPKILLEQIRSMGAILRALDR